MSKLGPAGAPGSLRARTHEVIYGHESLAGKAFDLILILAILGSVAAVMADSVAAVRQEHGALLRSVEWVFTVLFTVEYLVRLWCVDRPLRYAGSFFGLVDLFAVLPTYVSLLLPGGQYLAVIRILRVVRVFRVLKLARYMGGARLLVEALQASRYKVTVFLLAVVSIVVIVGALMYILEGPASGFTSIPTGVYWSIVTLTTVGYGDIAPQTPPGQILAAVLMILGYAIIAVPTGIVTVEMAYQDRKTRRGGERLCTACHAAEPEGDARFCRMCGSVLPSTP